MEKITQDNFNLIFRYAFSGTPSAVVIKSVLGKKLVKYNDSPKKGDIMWVTRSECSGNDCYLLDLVKIDMVYFLDTVPTKLYAVQILQQDERYKVNLSGIYALWSGIHPTRLRHYDLLPLKKSTERKNFWRTLNSMCLGKVLR